jgi:DNA-binding transcriptional MerR regulator
MNNDLITAGEFAKLTRTTKRTILWYDKIGILTPVLVDEAGYRFYSPEQIIDFQAILLLKQFGFSLQEIKGGLSEGRSLNDLFRLKQDEVGDKITALQNLLKQTKEYYNNLNVTGLLIAPTIRQLKSLDIYYIERKGPYSKIGDYFDELRKMFKVLPTDATFVAIYIEQGFLPKKANLKIGVVIKPGIKMRDGADVRIETIPTFRSLTYTHRGSSDLLSFLWRELDKYRQANHIKRDDNLPFDDLELYKSLPKLSGDVFMTELHVPIK